MAKKAYAGNEKNIRAKRFEEIRRLIAEEEIENQQDLLKRLNEEGYGVTQGTVSRDIRDLKLVRVALPGGGHRYREANAFDDEHLSDRFKSIFKNAVTSIDSALNQVVVKTYSGMAGAVCASMDSLKWDGLLGTIAGDDTILVVMRTESHALSLARVLAAVKNEK
ncbi:MAG: arginine repressor [Clostridia bacterium]|nr:arginine repressor [Clostridia bacterium]